MGGCITNTLIFIIIRKGPALLHMKFTAFNCFDYVIKMSDFGTKNHGFICKRNGSVSWLFCVFVLEEMMWLISRVHSCWVPRVHFVHSEYAHKKYKNDFVH